MSREISIRVRADNPALLTGLDRWVQLGLLGDREVREIASTHLSWVIPPPLPKKPPAATAPVASAQEFAAEPVTEPVIEPLFAAISANPANPAPPEPSPPPAAPASPPLPAIPEIWQTLRANFSILWLLGAGVFIIVAASTGLAITQWQTLPAVLQYGLLWAYTLGFAGASLWTARQENLVLTARSLQILAGLLVPVNFWAMHSFQLWRFGWLGGLAIALGALTLGGWTFLARLPLPGLYLGVSAIQLLWAQPFWVGLALQGGVIALAIAQEFRQQPPPLWAYYGLGLAFLRGLATRTIPLASFGLAFGAWGWLLGRGRERSESLTGPLIAGGDALAGGLLLGGAIATWQNPFPWQATGTVLLGIELCWQRLRRSQRGPDILGLFAAGAVGYALLWQWLPSAWQAAWIATLTRWLEIPRFGLDALTLLGILPYLFLFLGGLTILHRQSQFPQRLLRWGDAIVLSAAGLVALACLWSPGPRSLSLVGLGGLLAWVGSRWRNRILLTAAHGMGLLALGFGIAWQFAPSARGWLTLSLVLAVAEWLAGAWGDRQHRRNALRRMVLRQGWSFGALLAGLGYALLGAPTIWGTGWALLWEIVPVALAILAGSARIARRRQLATLSTGTLGAAILHVWTVPAYRIASLGLAALMMLLNVRNLPRLWVSATHIGYLLAYAGACLAPRLEGRHWFLAVAIALMCLFLGRQQLSKVYARASAGWAAVLAVVLGSGLGIHLVQYYGAARLRIFDFSAASSVPWQLPASAAVLLLAAILWYRQRSQATDFLASGALGIAGELALAEGLAFAGGNLEILAIGNLLASWSALAWPLRRRLESEVLAAGFGVLALLFHLGKFSAYGGFITLGVALLGLVLGARQQWKPLSQLAIAGVSLAVCELLLFQFWGSNGLAADGFLAFAAAATLIAIAYRLLAWGLPARIDLNLTPSELIAIARGHWWFGSITWLLVVGAAVVNPTLVLPTWSVAIGFLLAVWAFAVSRNPAEVRWIYGGWTFVVLAIAHWRLLQPSLSVLDPWQAAIALAFAWLAGLVPWERLGWPDRRVWHASALGLATLGIVLHWQDFTPYSGAIVLVAAVLSWRVGLQWPTKTPIYAALGGLSLAIVETALYGLRTDGAIGLQELSLALTTTAAAIAILYEAIAPLWPHWLRLTRSDLRAAAKIHGLAGIGLLGWMLIIGLAFPNWLPAWGIGLGAILAGWAFWRGRTALGASAEIPHANLGAWVYLGWGQLVATGIYARLALPDRLDALDNWWVTALGLLAWGALLLPWSRLGWTHPRPWERSALGLGAFAALLHISRAPDAYSGLELLVFAPLLLVLGARWQLRALTYGALAIVSVALGELLWFWLPLRGADVDIFLVVATAATAIACLYELLASRWPTPLSQRLNLARADLSSAATLHWWLANAAVVILAIATGDRASFLPLWVLSLPPLLAVWALARGRGAAAVWIYGGALELLSTVLWTRALIPSLQIYDPWWATLASFVALSLFHLPWQSWGWRDRKPWRHVAIALPSIAVFLSFATVSTTSLLLVAGYYGWLARQQLRWRWSYGSLPFLLWGLWQGFARLGWLDPAVIAALVGGTVLYVAQVDPRLRQPNCRNWRHWLRGAGSFPICATAAIVYGNPGIVPAALGLGFSLAGLALRVRAFLLVGSLALIWTVGDRALTLSQQYAFAQWLIGIAIGTALVSIGALFEGQRGQRLTALLQAWWQDLEHWD